MYCLSRVCSEEFLGVWVCEVYMCLVSYAVHAYRCFTKEMGVFANPTSKASPAKLRVAFEVCITV